jgi:predicted phosphodiesterase
MSRTAEALAELKTENHMKDQIDRRSFLKIAGMSLGIGVLYEFAPFLARRAEAGGITDFFKKANGEAPASFTFAQFSDPHVGFQGPPDPLGTKAFETAVELINKNGQRPDFVLFTGDLTHDAENRDAHAQRMQLFKSIAGRINTSALHMVPGENDAALDGGVLYREHFGETHYSFDHKGVHFVALDNVSRGRPEVGPDQLAWLKTDLGRFPKTAPIVVFTHRPLFDLKPEWEWFTADGDDVMNVLAPYENVTVLYGHIHRHHVQQNGRVKHYAARSLIFAFNDPATNEDKKQLPFNKDDPFKELGIRTVTDERDRAGLNVNDIVLARAEFSGLSGMQQMIKDNNSIGGGSANDTD